MAASMKKILVGTSLAFLDESSSSSSDDEDESLPLFALAT
jgi:hypothetical protein